MNHVLSSLSLVRSWWSHEHGYSKPFICFCSAGVRLIGLRLVILEYLRGSCRRRKGFPSCFTTRNDKHPSWAARADRAACCVVEWEAQDGLPAEQKVVCWACALVSNQTAKATFPKGVPSCHFCFAFSCTSFSFFPLGVHALVAFAQ